MAATLLCSPAFAQAPAGPELRVSTATTETDAYPSVAAAADGRFVVVWRWDYRSLRGGVTGQRFDARGARMGGEFQLSGVATSVPISFPSIAADSNGFTVVWWEPLNSNRFDVGAQRFAWDGVPITPAFRVNAYTTSGGGLPDVASDAAGNFVVVWPGPAPGATVQILGQRFDAQGGRRGGEFAISAANEYVSWSSVASDAAGNFVVAWEDLTTGSEGVFMRRFDANGTALGPQVPLDTGFMRVPSVARAPAGDFVIAWYDENYDVLHPLKGRKFLADGTPATPVLALDDGRPSRQWPPGLAMDAQGRFYAAWADAGADPSLLGTIVRGFNADGTPRGPGVVANTTTSGYQWMPSLTCTPAGHVTVTWWSDPTSFQPTFVAARRYGLLDVSSLRVDTTAGGAANGNGVLEVGESADFRPAWRNNSGRSLAMDGGLVLSGPPPGTYVADDAAGSYGIVAAGAGGPCLDCYAVRVTASQRPALHWDATATETIVSGEEGQYPWALHVGDSFPDVPRSSAYYPFVETLLHRGITAGCGGATYCPAQSTTREQMAVFVLRSKEISRYQPPYCAFQAPLFPDVPYDSPFCPWVEELARRGVVSGCGGGNYCPNDAVTREQMAVFLLHTLDPALNPPACTTPMFGDVPASSAFCRWIEELARRGITAGCGGGNYCPAQPVTREQMAAFLTATFGLTLYGP